MGPVVQGKEGGCWGRHVVKRGVEEWGLAGAGAGAKRAEGSENHRIRVRVLVSICEASQATVI